ncbi:FtsQ-type POTRA domain-containing protein [Cyanobacterium stanieri LEGE 03274]|uniref:FtsQ-type POTRA domain-containing protein n=1 Tax=Cyanobacterium stanieri LEGE 03274 TaxID=1828756 RepID=A0ABR9V477_9CHRO|nr:FtsQ-type POTRA domain-containing protein [Cyanobacterium stanieri]MBE9222687.1 FtsQ-type POTRA domain-containing protein [Cyanobacterium stanieri LEGE 03274]
MVATRNPVPPSQVVQHRKKLLKERAARNRIIACRFFVTIGIATGAFWCLTHPSWVLTSSEQIKIDGNELLSDDEIRSLIPLKYPSPILTLSGQQLGEKLGQQTPLHNITITKKILPPSLTIRVEENLPVAMAYGPKQNENGQVNISHLGFISADGIFVEKGMYQNLEQYPHKTPKLKVLGNPSLYLPYWQDLYSLLIFCAVPIQEVDWQNPNNIILSTDFGKVHLGPYTSKLPQQLQTLAEITTITQKIRREDIVYIDLINPNQPLVKEKPQPNKENN